MTEQKVNKFLKRSFAVMFIVCVAIFTWLTVYMSAKTNSLRQKLQEFIWRR